LDERRNLAGGGALTGRKTGLFDRCSNLRDRGVLVDRADLVNGGVDLLDRGGVLVNRADLADWGVDLLNRGEDLVDRSSDLRDRGVLVNRADLMDGGSDLVDGGSDLAGRSGGNLRGIDSGGVDGLDCDCHVSSLDVNIGVRKRLTILGSLGATKLKSHLENVEFAGLTVLFLETWVGLLDVLLGLDDVLV